MKQGFKKGNKKMDRLSLIFMAVAGGLIMGMLLTNIFAVMKETYTPTEVIKIKYFNGVEKIEKIGVGDWIDLRCAETMVLYTGESRLIPLGVAMELPEGYEAIMAPRSSTFDRHGIIMTNSIGVIDESYKGDNDQWHFPAYAVRGSMIRKNERICQFRIVKHQPPVALLEVESLGNANRGGIGSTGRM